MSEIHIDLPIKIRTLHPTGAVKERVTEGVANGELWKEPLLAVVLTLVPDILDDIEHELAGRIVIEWDRCATGDPDGQ